MTILSVKNLEKEYIVKGQRTPALRGISLDVYKGEFVVIMGPSGSGKSTLINILGTIDKKAKGEVLYDGKNLLKAKEKFLSGYRKSVVGIVFQNFNLIGNATVRYNLELPTKVTGIQTEKNHTTDIIAYFNLADKLEAQVDLLSQGEQQQVAIARSVMNEPEIILADEPTGNLDSVSGEHVGELFNKLNKEKGKTIVFVTHNNAFTRYADRIVYLQDGQIDHIDVIHDKSNEQPESSTSLAPRQSKPSFKNFIQLGLENIIRYKLRYICLAIGLSIGVAFIGAFIMFINVLVSNSLSTLVPEQDQHVILAQRQYILPKAAAGHPLTDQSLQTIKEIPGTTEVYPQKDFYGSITNGLQTSAFYAITGSPVAYHHDSAYHIIQGTYFHSDDQKAIIITTEQAAALGMQLPQAIGTDLTVQATTSENVSASKLIPTTLTVIGILDPNVFPQNDILPSGFYMQYGTQEKIHTYDDIYIYVPSLDNVKTVGQEVTSLGYTPVYIGEKERGFDIGAIVGQDIVIFLAAGGLFSLIFNMLNVMILLFFSRTRETGILKIVGARFREILSIYFSEGLIFGIATGIITMIITALNVAILNVALNAYTIPQTIAVVQTSHITFDPGSFILILLASILLCVLTMTYPVLRSSKRTITEALQRE